MIRVLISSRRSLSTDLLARAMKIESEFDLVDVTTTDEEMIAALRDTTVDIVLVDSAVSSGATELRTSLRRLRDVNRTVKVIALIPKDDPVLVVTAFSNGAQGIFTMEAGPEALWKSIKRVYEGQIWANDEELHWIVQALSGRTFLSKKARDEFPHNSNPLSKREMEVTYLLMEGLTNREIARRMSVSENTVKNYLFRMYGKLGISSRTELLLRFMKP